MIIDSVDRRILSELQVTGKISNVDLARKVNLSPSPCLARVKRLEKEGLIQNYVALLDAKKLGLDLNVFVFISLKAQSRELLKDFETRVCAHGEVMECYLMTGESDYLIRVAVRDMEELETFIVDHLSPIPEVQTIRSSLALKQVTYKTALPLSKVLPS